MKINKKKVLYGLFLAGMIFIIYKNTTQPTNNADKYFQEYFEGVKLLPAIIDEPYKLDMGKQFVTEGLQYIELQGKIRYSRNYVYQRY